MLTIYLLRHAESEDNEHHRNSMNIFHKHPENPNITAAGRRQAQHVADTIARHAKIRREVEKCTVLSSSLKRAQQTCDTLRDRLRKHGISLRDSTPCTWLNEVEDLISLLSHDELVRRGRGVFHKMLDHLATVAESNSCLLVGHYGTFLSLLVYLQLTWKVPREAQQKVSEISPWFRVAGQSRFGLRNAYPVRLSLHTPLSRNGRPVYPLCGNITDVLTGTASVLYRPPCRKDAVVPYSSSTLGAPYVVDDIFACYEHLIRSIRSARRVILLCSVVLQSEYVPKGFKYSVLSSVQYALSRSDSLRVYIQTSTLYSAAEFTENRSLRSLVEAYPGRVQVRVYDRQGQKSDVIKRSEYISNFVRSSMDMPCRHRQPSFLHWANSAIHRRFLCTESTFMINGTNVSRRLMDHEEYVYFEQGLVFPRPSARLLQFLRRYMEDSTLRVPPGLPNNLVLDNRTQYQAIKKLIRDATTCIYIHHQYFFSGSHSYNMVSKLLIQKIETAHHEQRDFHVRIDVNATMWDELSLTRKAAESQILMCLQEFWTQVQAATDNMAPKYVDIRIPSRTTEGRSYYIHNKIIGSDNENFVFSTANILDASFSDDGMLEMSFVSVSNRALYKRVVSHVEKLFERRVRSHRFTDDTKSSSHVFKMIAAEREEMENVYDLSGTRRADLYT